MNRITLATVSSEKEIKHVYISNDIQQSLTQPSDHHSVVFFCTKALSLCLRTHEDAWLDDTRQWAVKPCTVYIHDVASARASCLRASSTFTRQESSRILGIPLRVLLKWPSGSLDFNFLGYRKPEAQLCVSNVILIRGRHELGPWHTPKRPKSTVLKSVRDLRTFFSSSSL